MTDWNKIPMPERKDMMMQLSYKGICPVCEIPMTHINGKPTHSKTKLKICENIFRRLTSIQKGVQLPDGRNLEVNAKFVPKSEVEKINGFRD